MHYKINNIRAKSNAHYICQECDSTEFIQAHHQIPKDDASIIVLCASCHSAKHPNVPLGLFFQKNAQPYWTNTLAKKAHCHPRTIIRRARKLNIPKGILNADDEAKLFLNQKGNPRKPRLKRERRHLRRLSINIPDDMNERIQILVGHRQIADPSGIIIFQKS